MLHFLISLLHWSQISFPRAFIWGLETASSHWGSDLENKVGVEAIWSAIHIVLPLLWLTWDMVHCLGEKVLFLLHLWPFFWWFLPSNAPIMLYNIPYWWFFLSQGNRWTKCLAHPKIWMPIPCWCLRLNHCFRRSRVWITLIKPLLCLNSIFPFIKQCFINTRNSDFSTVLKIYNRSFTEIIVICKLIIQLCSNFDSCHLKVSTL